MRRLPREQAIRGLQSWMTFFTLLFAYLGVTHVFDETANMIFRPKTYAEMQRVKEQSAAQSQSRLESARAQHAS